MTLDPAIEPMPDPVAPPGRVCATCRWWDAEQRIGACTNPAVYEMVHAIPSARVPPPDFGCNQWRAKS